MPEPDERRLISIFYLPVFVLYILHHRFPILPRLGREEMGYHQKMDFTRHSSITAREAEPCQQSTPKTEMNDRDTNNTGSPTQNTGLGNMKRRIHIRKLTQTTDYNTATTMMAAELCALL